MARVRSYMPRNSNHFPEEKKLHLFLEHTSAKVVYGNRFMIVNQGLNKLIPEDRYAVFVKYYDQPRVLVQTDDIELALTYLMGEKE